MDDFAPKEGVVDMKKSDSDGVVEGLNEAIAFARGDDVPGLRVHILAEIDIKAIRGELAVTQGRSSPSGTAFPSAPCVTGSRAAPCRTRAPEPT